MDCRVEGVLETALYVRDLDTAQQFYERVFGFNEIMREENRLHALSIAGKQVLLLFRIGASVRPTQAPGGTIPPHDGHGTQHLAFEVTADQIEHWRAKLGDLGVPIESEVECPKGGHSIYFRDPDDHLIELVTRDCWGI